MLMNIILTGTSPEFLTELIVTLSTEFALKDLGDLKFFLGIELQSTSQGIHVTQTKYTKEVLQKANMLEAAHISTPMATSISKSSNDEELVDPTTYRSLVGSLQYLTLTRPDIVQAVNKVCQHLQQPQLQHWRAVKRILRYLKGTMTYGISFSKHSSNNLYAFL